MFNKNRLGLIFGGLAALCHAIWVVVVASGNGKAVLDWFMSMHFMTDASYEVTAFAGGAAVLLVVMAFIYGYIGGFVFGAILNWSKK